MTDICTLVFCDRVFFFLRLLMAKEVGRCLVIVRCRLALARGVPLIVSLPLW